MVTPNTHANVGRRIWLLTGILVLAALLMTGIANADDSFAESPASAPAQVRQADTVNESPIPCRGDEQVALVQDNVPWTAAANQDPLGAIVTELKAQHRRFCVLGSQDVASVNLNRFDEVIIAAGQSQEFYDNLFPLPDGEVVANLVDYVQRGGILSANLTDNASGAGNFGTWSGRVFIGGLTYAHGASNDVDIAARQHPMITGDVPCQGGHCGRLVDRDTYLDLDGWGNSHHGHFENLPPGTRVILESGSGQPVMIEYRLGRGVVVASRVTTEWQYVGGFGGSLPQNPELLANELAYQSLLATASRR